MVLNMVRNLKMTQNVRVCNPVHIFNNINRTES
jgi:hypothetical protein